MVYQSDQLEEATQILENLINYDTDSECRLCDKQEWGVHKVDGEIVPINDRYLHPEGCPIGDAYEFLKRLEKE
jgi:hypothetical protein